MGFFIFLVCCNMLIPLTMFGFGRLLEKRPPASPNAFCGYRTPMSCKNLNTWVFANTYCGRLWRRLSYIMMPVTLAVSLGTWWLSEDGQGTVSLILCSVQCAVMIGSIWPVERALKRHFDEKGNIRGGEHRKGDECQ